jgi:hypothetical protein
MRPFKRRTFAMNHDGHRLQAAGAASGFEAFAFGGGGGERRPTLVEAAEPAPAAAVAATPTLAPRPLESACAAKPNRNWTVTDGAVEPMVNRDAALAERIVGLVQELNQAMNDAVQNGLIVEPVLSRVKSRYNSLDDEGTYVLSLKLFRKLC